MINSHQNRTKRIVYNTLYLYSRMLLLMFIAFYTSRVVLDKLGVIDYGIHNVVGGLATMFIFFRSTLSNVTQRYLNIKLGENDIVGAQLVFSQHQSLYILISILVLLVAELIGPWYIINKLVIPPERVTAALWVFHFTIVSFVITILSVVYDSAIIAHEDMKIYSFVAIYEGVSKLFIAIFLSYSPFDRLITYGFLLLVLTFSIRLFYAYYCKKKYLEAVFEFVWKKTEIKNAFSFISWNFVNTVIWVINDQGVNLLLNYFCGPVVNASRGLSYHVNRVVRDFGANFYTAVQPQLIKSYALQDDCYMYNLFYKSSKFSVFLLWYFCLPLILFTDVVLSLWLKEVPEYTSSFTIWVLAYTMVNALVNPIWTLTLAVGKLKKYIIIGGSVLLLVFPISFILLKMGVVPTSVFILSFIIRIIYVGTIFVVLHSYVKVSYKDYFIKVINPILLVVFISGVILFLCSQILPKNILGLVILCVLSTFLISACIWLFGMENIDKKLLKQFVQKQLN